MAWAWALASRRRLLLSVLQRRNERATYLDVRYVVLGGSGPRVALMVVVVGRFARCRRAMVVIGLLAACWALGRMRTTSMQDGARREPATIIRMLNKKTTLLRLSASVAAAANSLDCQLPTQLFHNTRPPVHAAATALRWLPVHWAPPPLSFALLITFGAPLFRALVIYRVRRPSLPYRAPLRRSCLSTIASQPWAKSSTCRTTFTPFAPFAPYHPSSSACLASH
jgi:hypothetical protein